MFFAYQQVKTIARLDVLAINIAREFYNVEFFRSRTATPSSFSGTPPQQQPQHHQQQQHHLQQQQHHQSNENINQNASAVAGSGGGSVGSGSMKPDFPPRNYSDFIRSLAAKYNNGNPNE